MLWTTTDYDRVRVLTANRPDALNAMNGALVSGLIEVLTDAAKDDSVRVTVLTGSGKAFSAGADLDLLSQPDTEENRRMLSETIPAMFDLLVDYPKPLLMAVNGLGVGFGATVLGLADLVIMAESARIMVPFSTLSVVPEACSSYSFPQRIGYQKAFWFLLSGEWMSAEECVAAGLALEAVPSRELMEKALEKAQTLARFPTHTLIESKRLMRMPHREQLLAANRAEIDRLVDLLHHPACKEGIAAICEQRQPDYGAY